MAAAVQQPLARTTDGISMYPAFKVVQPVPFASLPASAGVLPSWESKKNEISMAGLNIEASNGLANGHARKASTASTSSGHAKLHKPPNANAVTGNPKFLNSLRTASTSSTASQQSQYANGISNKGVEPSPLKQEQKKQNKLLRYLQKHFSANRSGTAGNTAIASKSAQQQHQKPTTESRGIGYTKNAGIAMSPAKKTRNNAFVEKMKAASGKVTNRIQMKWKKFNSKTPKEQLPKNWDDWRAAYARGDIDVLDMPDPPPRAAGSNDPSPQEAGFLAAPLPENQRERHLAYNRIDHEGKRGVKASQIAVPEGEEALPDTLEGHPAFRNIVTQARALFDSSISILTVFNENRQLFLAETGLGGMKEVGREVTFCSHAVLQRPPQPFVLHDTHDDWRFAKSPLVVQYGCRAYYGVPLLAPDFSGESREPIPIGTLCVIDNKPRPTFTPEQRSKMSDLALLAQKTIANWSRARLQARLDAMEASFNAWKVETQNLAIGHPPATKPVESTQPLNGPKSSEVLHISSTQQTPTMSRGGSNFESGSLSPSQQESFHTAPGQTSNRQKIYDISTRLVANSLELDLVYILRLDLFSHSPLSDIENTVKSLSLVSSYGMPTPEPAFDAVLHMKALRSEEGGLLYQNPRIEELVAGEQMPSSDDVEYASALLVPISESPNTGYVLAGFTEDSNRVFERDDLLYLTTIASELSVYLQE